MTLIVAFPSRSRFTKSLAAATWPGVASRSLGLGAIATTSIGAICLSFFPTVRGQTSGVRTFLGKIIEDRSQNTIDKFLILFGEPLGVIQSIQSTNAKNAVSTDDQLDRPSQISMPFLTPQLLLPILLLFTVDKECAKLRDTRNGYGKHYGSPHRHGCSHLAYPPSISPNRKVPWPYPTDATPLQIASADLTAYS